MLFENLDKNCEKIYDLCSSADGVKMLNQVEDA